MRWFADPKIGAVAGNAKVGNRINMITRWQALEYIVAQNLERRALSALDTLTVVPGAVGAWRREALLELGGFPADTLAEDQDLTIAIQTAGYRVLFDTIGHRLDRSARHRARAGQAALPLGVTARCNACGNTAASPSIRAIGALGMVALPQVWLFQIMLTTLAPVADLLLVWQLVGQWIAYLAAWRGIHRQRSQARRHLLCRLHRGRSAGGRGRLSDGDGARTGACCGGCCCSASAIAS